MTTDSSHIDRRPIDIAVAGAGDAAAWDAYVDGHAESNFFQRFGWAEIIEAVYGYEPVYLMARRGAAVVGVLPLIDAKTPLLGRSLISTAFTIGGGPLADDETIISALAERAVEEGAARRVQYVELRTETALIPDWISKSDIYATFKTTIPENEEEHLAFLRRSRRRAVRRARRGLAEGELREAVAFDADRFYQVYAQSLRNHGTPVFPRKFLVHLLRVFSKEIEISFTESRGETAGALLSFYYKNAVMPYYFGATSAGRDVHAQEYQYWALMRRAAGHGVRVFDFGRSKVGSGPYKFKELWNIEPTPLSYQYKLIAADDMPNVNPENPKFKSFVALWKRLPVPVANRIGPLLTRNFP